MALEVDAIYENGVLRPLQPLDLKEHEHVVVSIEKPEGESKGPLGPGVHRALEKGTRR